MSSSLGDYAFDLFILYTASRIWESEFIKAGDYILYFVGGG